LDVRCGGEEAASLLSEQEMEFQRCDLWRIHGLHACPVLAGAIHVFMECIWCLHGSLCHHWNVRHHTVFSPQLVAQKLQAPQMVGVHFCLLRRASSAGKLSILHHHMHFLLSSVSSREKAVDSAFIATLASFELQAMLNR